MTLVFDIPEQSAERFSYAPGQFLTVQVPSDRCGSVARCYSLSSSPACDERPAITVKRTSGGYASNWLCDNTAVGTELTVLEPSGVFVPRSLDIDVLLCAAGSGITPMMSILKSILHAGTGKVAMFYANQNHDSVIFAKQMGDLIEQFGERFTVMHWLADRRGLPTVEAIRDFASDYRDRDVFLCGPTGYAEATHAALASIQVPRNRIHVEQYRSLDANPFAESSATPLSVSQNTTDDTTSLRVEFEGQTYDLQWPRDQKLLDVLLDAGLDIPYVCRESACGTCVCSVRGGATRMLLNESLIDEELEQGLTLACQTMAQSDRVHVTFD